MAFRRMNDKMAKINAKSFSVFRGSHYGFGKCDQPDTFAYLVDLAVNNEKLELRDGARKNSTTGYTATVTNVFRMGVGGVDSLGVVVNGILTVHSVSDIMAAIRKYYTWREVASGFTWEELFDGKTWNDLVSN